jgi:hypothetical protein
MQRALIALLLLSFIAVAACSDSTTEPQPIASGTWTGSTTGMSLEFTVDAGGGTISEIVYTFSGFQCGGTTINSGSITSSRDPAWPITNRQFEITRSSDPTIDVAGTFGNGGTTVSGTWEWMTCSGTWTGSH